MIANGMPTPMPIFAPLERPVELGVGVEEGVDIGCVVVAVGCEVVNKLDELELLPWQQRMLPNQSSATISEYRPPI
jgi:hypothetical protein